MQNDTTVLAIFAGDTAFIFTSTGHPTSVDNLQYLLDTFHERTSRWKIKANGAKLTNVVFTFLPLPHIRVNGVRDVRSIFHRVITFFDIRGIINHKFVEPGTTVNALYYKTVLQKVKKAVKKKGGSDHHWFLHCSLIVQQYLAKKAVTAITHPPYSPDLSPCDVFFISTIQADREREWFQTTEEIRLATERELCKITPANFQHCNPQWVER